MSNAPSYKANDPRGWCGDPSRGAAMGRGSYHAEDKNAPVKLFLRKVRLDSGGYDSNGTYFGRGLPLYWAASADNEVDYMLRAQSRAAAKALVWKDYPEAYFYR